MHRLALLIAACLCLFAGLATLWLPLPTGLLLLALGTGLLLIASPRAARRLAALRRHYRGLDRQLRRAEPWLPRPFRAALAQTRAARRRA